MPEESLINTDGNNYIGDKNKYNEIKNGLSPNLRIESFKGDALYDIMTYEYPRKEAFKIIDDYKNGVKEH